jgi:hypothetical protein
MAGIFPDPQDGGIPPNPHYARNPLSAYDPAVEPLDTACLYYANGCDVHLRPHVLNALISEIEAVVDQAGLPYNTGSQENLERAIRYIIQRGLPKGAVAEDGPFNYNAFCDPPVTGYSDFLVLRLVPERNNQALVRLNVNNKGFLPLLRNDGQELRSGDWLEGITYNVIYYAGAWRILGLSASQVPLVRFSAVDIWIRSDGNDETGDGSENLPDKAYRTIAGAWRGVGSRYAATPLFSIWLRLGMPGTYTGTQLGPFGGGVHLVGDVNNRAAYKIGAWDGGNNSYYGINAMTLPLTVHGVTFLAEIGAPYNMAPVYSNSDAVFVLDSCAFDVTANNNGTWLISCVGGGIVGFRAGEITCNGHGRTIGGLIQCTYKAKCLGGYQIAGTIMRNNDMNFYFQGLRADGVSLIAMCSPLTTMLNTNCTGQRYSVSENSIIRLCGQDCPGNAAGFEGTGGIFAGAGVIPGPGGGTGAVPYYSQVCTAVWGDNGPLNPPLTI